VVALHRILRDFGDDVRFVHIVRDGRDVVTSSHPDHGGDYVSLERWVSHVSAGLAFRDHPRVYTLRYEDLVTDYETAIRELLDWLEEPFCEEVAHYERHTSVRQSNAWFGGVRPISGSSVEKWRSGAHADVLAAFAADPRATALLRMVGYPPSAED
jgi:hypothetical protein